MARGSEVSVHRASTRFALAGVVADGFTFAAHGEDGCEFLYFVHIFLAHFLSLS